MTCENRVSEILRQYDIVAGLSEKNGCRVLRIRHMLMKTDLVMRVMPEKSEVYEHLCRIRCDDLPKVYDVIDCGDGAVVLEEYVEGISLYDMIAGEKLDKKKIKAILKGLCLGLQVLHENRIVHKDIKPENIIVDKNGRAVLIDFNASRIMSLKRQDTVVMGTVGYAAPEQFGIGASDARTDIYAMGIVINIMATGLHPSISLADGAVGRIVKKCTDIQPEKRYKNAKELYQAISRAVF